MARKKRTPKAAAEAPETPLGENPPPETPSGADTGPDVFDEAIAAAERFEQEAHELPPMTPEEIRSASPDAGPAPADHPDSPRPGPRRPPKSAVPIDTQTVGDDTIRLLDGDNGQLGGIHVAYADPAERPSPAVLKILRDDRTHTTPGGFTRTHKGLKFNPETHANTKRISRDPAEALPDRLDIEGRFAETVEQRRTERGERDR